MLNYKNLLVKIIIGCCIFSISTCGIAKTISPLDFSYGATINTVGNDALYKVTLPGSVYKYLMHKDYSDIRVFNANNEIVPSLLLDPQPVPSEQKLELPFFVINTAPESVGDNLSMFVARNGQGAILYVKDEANTNNHSANANVHYLIDASSLKQKTVSSLLLSWQNTQGSWVNGIKLYASDDLQHWVDVAPTTSVAQFERGGGANVLHNSIEINGIIKHHYLMLAWDVINQPVTITNIMVKVINTAPVELQWIDVKNTATNSDSEYFFEKPTALEAFNLLKFSTDAKNLLAKMKVFSRATSEQSWIFEREDSIYDLSLDGQKITKLDSQLNGISGKNRYWKVVFDQSSNVSAKNVQIAVGVSPKQVVFAAQGAAPFVLAYGATRINYLDEAATNALRQLNHDGYFAKLPLATLAKPHVLGGEKVIKPTYTQRSYLFIYWGLMLAGIVILSYMAFSIVKQIKPKKTLPR